MVVGMVEDHDQGPHYIPELDPERSKFDGGWLKDFFYYYSAYVVTTGLASLMFFLNEERVLGFAIAGFGIGIVVFAIWFLGRSNREPTEESAMPDEREQNPHYIPELDPENPKYKKGFGEPLLWLSMIGGVAAVICAGVAWQFDQIGATKFLAAVGAILFSPLVLITLDGLSAGGA
jgi:hypothetical protein